MNSNTSSKSAAVGKVPKQLLLVSLSFLVPIVVMFWLIVRGLNEHMDFARLEQAGNEYQAALEPLLDLLPQHRLAAQRLQTSDPAGRGKLSDLESQIDRALTDLEAVDAKLGERLEFTTRGLAKRSREWAQVAKLQAEWLDLRSRLAVLSPAARDERHVRLIASVRMMISHAGDTSNLILDPDLDTYYLIDVTLLALPQAQDRMGVMMASGEEVLSRGKLDPGHRRELGVFAALLKESDVDRILSSARTAMNEDANFHGIRPTFRPTVTPALDEFAAASGEFIRLTTALAEADPVPVSREEFLAAGARARAAGFRLWTAARGELDGLLQERIDHYARARLQAVTLVAFALAASGVFVFFVVRKIRVPLQRQAEALGLVNDQLQSEVVKYAQAEASLRESEARMRAIVDTALDAVVTMDATGRIVGWNTQAETIFGWSREEAIGRTLSEAIVPPQHREAHERGLKRFLATGHGPVLNRRIEITALRRDGHEIDVELAITPLKTEGRVEFSAFLRDISERKRTQAELTKAHQELQASEHRMRMILEASPECVKLVAADGTLLEMNPAGLRLIEADNLEQAIGRNVFDLVTPEDHAVFRELNDAVFQGESRTAEFTITGMKGTRRFMETHACPLRGADGGVIAQLAITRDVSERKRGQAELEKAHRELLDLSRQAGMAEVATAVLHNVGNVLNSVNVSATLVGEQLTRSRVADLNRVVTLLQEHAGDLGAFLSADPKGQKVPAFLAQLAERLGQERSQNLQELEALRKNIEHIKEIVAMQQSYAKVSGVTEVVSVTELIEDTLRMNHGSFLRHDLEVVREFGAGPLPPITTEKHKVLQILVNLVRNAKHACDNSGRADKRLVIGVAHQANRVKISVRDNGVGILPENLTRIFGHGFTTKKDGHGFGLHSGALAAKELGGCLSVHSDGPGQGAVFTLELPAAQPCKNN